MTATKRSQELRYKSRFNQYGPADYVAQIDQRARGNLLDTDGALVPADKVPASTAAFETARKPEHTDEGSDSAALCQPGNLGLFPSVCSAWCKARLRACMPLLPRGNPRAKTPLLQLL